MSTLEIICLANSRKKGGRCIAGVRTDGGGWVRPVASRASSEQGELHPQHYRLSDGSEPKILDILQIDLASPQPESHQPENWLVGNKQWERVSFPASLDFSKLLVPIVARHPNLFGNPFHRVSCDSFFLQPSQASLTLVMPKNLRWCITTNTLGRRQSRAIFSLHGTSYNLVVTDTVWENLLSALPMGVHPATAANLENFEPDKVLLTISLGEPYEGYCYKLVAAVLQVAHSVLSNFAANSLQRW